jgi:hypothetical protein
LIKDLNLSKDAALQLRETFHTKLFCSFTGSATAICHQYRTDKARLPICNLLLSTVLDTDHFSASCWNRLVQEVKQHLVMLCSSSEVIIHFMLFFMQILEFLVLVWSKLKDNGFYERAGVAWVISDEVVFEVKGVRGCLCVIIIY